MKKVNNKTTIIIGGGPAGISAALQLKRYGLEPILLERREVGGLLWNANLVENYLGFPNGVRGEKLIGLMKAQIKRIGVHVKREEVLSVDWQSGQFTVTTNLSKHTAEYLIIASGTKSKALPKVIRPQALAFTFTEVWPLREKTEKQVVIVGAGDAAFDYALNLSKRRNFVTILNRGDSVQCLELLFDRAMREPLITYQSGVAVREVRLREDATRLEVRCEARGGEEILESDYILFAIGRDPNMDFLSEQVRQREQELVKSGRLYFVGDVKNELFRQAAIAAGDGLRAAMQIYSRISK